MTRPTLPSSPWHKRAIIERALDVKIELRLDTVVGWGPPFLSWGWWCNFRSLDEPAFYLGPSLTEIASDLIFYQMGKLLCR